MHTDKEEPAGDWHPATGHTDGDSIPAGVAAVAKHLETLRAKFALRGHELHVTPTGYFVTRWSLTRELPTMADVHAFLTQIGGST